MRLIQIFAFGTIFSASAILALSLPANADQIEGEWWLRKSVPAINSEQAGYGKSKPAPTKPTASDTTRGTTSGSAADDSSSKSSPFSAGGSSSQSAQPFQLQTSENLNGNVQTGNFVIPGWFSSQPKPYERPIEFQQPSAFGQEQRTFASVMPGMGLGGFGGFGGVPFGGVPFGGYGYGYGNGYGWGGRNFGPGFGFGGPAMGFGGFAPGFGPGMGFGGYRGFGPGMGLGGFGGPMGFGGFGPGFGGFGPGMGFGGFGGFGPGMGFGGFGGYGPGFGFGSPAGGALFAGAFGNSMFGGSRNGMLSPTRFNQSAPSKASGNYYEPSTVDSTASGSYYASGAPAMTPIMSAPQAPKDYWGPGGNPFDTQPSQIK